MDASKISFFSATKEALANPGLDMKKRRELKVERVKTFIRTKPVGYKFRLSDLISAAGYNANDEKAYASGYAFVRALDGTEITIERTPKFRKSVVVLNDDTVHVTTPKREETAEPEKAGEDKPSEEPELLPKLMVAPVDVKVVRYIEKLARDFSWRNNSNDLREFVRSLK